MSTHDVSVAHYAAGAAGARETAYGPLVSASDVEQALVELVQLWLADYLAEVCRQHELAPDYLPMPRAWVVSSDVEKMPEDQTPAILVASPGLTDPPKADGSGSYIARWRVSVAVHLSAQGNALALRLVRLYVCALRALLLQQHALTSTTLDGLALRRFDWMDERYDTLPSIDDRTVCTGAIDIDVELADVTRRHTGPLAPLLGPGNVGPDSPAWPTAESSHVDIDKQ